MIDSLGAVQSLAILGGTSEIGLAVCRELAVRGRLQRVALAGRDPATLEDAALNVKAWGVNSVRTVPFDATVCAGHGATVRELFADGDVDVVLLAFGVLEDRSGTAGTAGPVADPEQAVRVAQVNYVGAVSVGLRVATALRQQGHGTLVVVSSVAAERGRAGNFVYGSTKAGLDTFAQGLGDRLHGTGVRVMVVRPGFVRTRMTAGMPEAPFACDAADVGRAVARALRTHRQIVWVPPVLRVVMSGVRHLPRPLFRRLPG